MSRRAAIGTRNGSRCPPVASTYATCRCRYGRARRPAPPNSSSPACSVTRSSRALISPRAVRLAPRPPLRALQLPLAYVLQHLLALGGSGVTPALAQRLAPLGRQLLELAEILPHDGLLVRRERFELVPTLAQHPPLLGGQRAPLLEALTRQLPLVGRHSQPTPAAARQRLLPCRRQAAPLALETRQELVLLGREARPANRRRSARRRRARLRLRKRRRRRREQQREQQRLPLAIHCLSS